MDKDNHEKKDEVVILGEHVGKIEEEELKHIKVDLIEPNKNQPRKTFDQDKLLELSKSIQQYGVLQPIVIKPTSEDNDKYTIIAGERRWRACKMANLKEIPSIIKLPEQEKDTHAIALIENLQRQNLKLTEEAECYKSFIEKNHCTQDELSQIIGKSRSHVTNLIRITKLSGYIKSKIDEGLLSLGHAKILASQEKADELANTIISKKLSVRDTEQLIQDKLGTSSLEKNLHKDAFYQRNKLHAEKNEISKTDLLEIQSGLEKTLDAKVKFNLKANDTGKITISFNSLDELDEILEKMSRISQTEQ